MLYKLAALFLCLGATLIVGCHSRGQSMPSYNSNIDTGSGGDSDSGDGGDNGDDDNSGDDDGGDNGDGGGGGDDLVWPPSDCNYSMIDETWRPEQDAIWYFNSQFNGNKTMRWRNGAIKVKVLDPRIDEEALRDIFDELNQYTHPVSLHIFNGPVSQADIVIDLNVDLVHNTGFAVWQTDEQNQISTARIELAIYEGHDCYFYAIVKHYLLQTLGIFNYAQDGGVMAEEFYNDRVTALVVETLMALYDLPPGSAIGPEGPEN